MTISGFTMVRNATKLYFPIKESIESVLPLVDEFIVALGEGDEGDRTREEILSINSPKIKIIDRTWDPELFKKSEIFRHETNFAMDQCSGDWCFYIQADEVIHEKDLNLIRRCCEKYLDRKEVEGFLFKYNHFWGDYDHYLPFHGWYKNEIRIVRNNCGIRSYKDAQSFRKEDGSRLRVIQTPAEVFHYGWVRPPETMISKKKVHDTFHWGAEKVKEFYKDSKDYYDYGPLGRIPKFNGNHPAVMKERIAKHHWKEALNYGTEMNLNRKLNKHEKLKYRALTFIENNLLGGRELFGYSNWIKIGDVSKFT